MGVTDGTIKFDVSHLLTTLLLLYYHFQWK
jgi:hypothetical protein